MSVCVGEDEDDEMIKMQSRKELYCKQKLKILSESTSEQTINVISVSPVQCLSLLPH